MPNKDDLQKLVYKRERRLQKLKEDEALYGKRVNTILEIEDVEESLEALQTELETSKSVIRQNLPQPDFIDFVGRTEEMKRILELLSPHHRVWTIVIDGIGGIGKSALALEVAHYYLRNYRHIPPEERFDAIVWTSGKRVVLTDGGIVSRHQVLRTLDDIYVTIAVREFQKNKSPKTINAT